MRTGARSTATTRSSGKRSNGGSKTAIKPDLVNHPPHYIKGRFETIDVLEDIIGNYPTVVMGFSVAQTVKYLSRAPLKKNLLEDLKKAQWYLARAVMHAGG